MSQIQCTNRRSLEDADLLANPDFCLVVLRLFFRKRKYLVEHVVRATHFWAFNLLLLGVILPVATIAMLRVFKTVHISAAYATDDAVTSTFVQICVAAYLFMMLREFYGVTRWYSLLTASVIAWSFFHIVWLYRFFLFEITLSLV